MLSNFGQVLIFMIISIAFIGVAIITARILAPRFPSKGKYSTYECGEETVGDTWIRFNFRYYVVALIFIIFDVEIVFLFPWAVVFKSLGALAFVEMAVFLFILIIGFIYAYAKGDLYWDKPQPIIPKLERQIFKSEE